jgi:hypothetical protein
VTFSTPSTLGTLRPTYFNSRFVMNSPLRKNYSFEINKAALVLQ